MPPEEAKDGIAVEPNQVLIIPPEQPAEEFDERAVGVILAGARTDRTLG